MSNENKPMSVGDWLATLIISAIPLIGFIVLLVWVFSKDTNENKKNWAKAVLILYAIVIMIYIFFAILIFLFAETIASFIELPF